MSNQQPRGWSDLFGSMTPDDSMKQASSSQDIAQIGSGQYEAMKASIGNNVFEYIKQLQNILNSGANIRGGKDDLKQTLLYFVTIARTDVLILVNTQGLMLQYHSYLFDSSLTSRLEHIIKALDKLIFKQAGLIRKFKYSVEAPRSGLLKKELLSLTYDNILNHLSAGQYKEATILLLGTNYHWSSKQIQKIGDSIHENASKYPDYCNDLVIALKFHDGLHNEAYPINDLYEEMTQIKVLANPFFSFLESHHVQCMTSLLETAIDAHKNIWDMSLGYNFKHLIIDDLNSILDALSTHDSNNNAPFIRQQS